MKAGLRLSLLVVAIAHLVAVNGIPVLLITSPQDAPQHDNTAALNKRVGLSDALLTETARVIDGNHPAAELQDLFPAVPGDLRSTARLNLQPNEARASSSTSHEIFAQPRGDVSTTLTLSTLPTADARPSGSLRNLPSLPAVNGHAKVGLTQDRLDSLYSSNLNELPLKIHSLHQSISLARSELRKALADRDDRKLAGWRLKIDADYAIREALSRRLEGMTPPRAEKYAEDVFDKLSLEPVSVHLDPRLGAYSKRGGQKYWYSSRFTTPDLQRGLERHNFNTIKRASDSFRHQKSQASIKKARQSDKAN